MANFFKDFSHPISKDSKSNESFLIEGLFPVLSFI